MAFLAPELFFHQALQPLLRLFDTRSVKPFLFLPFNCDSLPGYFGGFLLFFKYYLNRIFLS